jgi:hypothetical protein
VLSITGPSFWYSIIGKDNDTRYKFQN